MLLRRLPLRRYASSAKNKIPRLQRIDEANYYSLLTLQQLDAKYNIFSASVTKVVDLGFMPGNWLDYARYTLLAVHDVEPDKINTKCTLLGFDLLFGKPPPGTSSSQGNIFSQTAQSHIVDLLKEAALRRVQPEKGQVGQDYANSYLLKEIQETRIENELDALADAFSEYSLADGVDYASIVGPGLYQADVITSDLSWPFLQDGGFWNNTMSRPHTRSSTNESLRRAIVHSEKSSIDLAEAALLLCGDALAKNGTFVVRLAKVDLADPELSLLESRLQKMFTSVSRWSPTGVVSSQFPLLQDLYMVGHNKKDYFADKYDIFDVKRAT